MSRFHFLILITANVVFQAWKPWVFASPCSPRHLGDDRMVCVCNLTYCDTLHVPSAPPAGYAFVVQSSKDGDRFANRTLPFGPNITENLVESESIVQVIVDPSQEFQEITGFGGAFTDSAGINFVSLPASMRNDIVQAYYSVNGSEYNIGRIPMASCDFSTRSYSYNDVPGDMELEHFQLAPEDLTLKIPFIQEAKKISTQPLLLFASPWAPPSWMKTNEKSEGSGRLKGEVGGEYFRTWANYFVKFLQAYEEHNLTFWGLTTQNEPMDGFIPGFPFQCLAFSAETQRDFIAENLGPTLQQAGYGANKVKLMIMDDQRVLLPRWPKTVLENATVAEYVSGIAFHWYTNFLAPTFLLDRTHELFPEKFLISSEACEGSYPWQLHKVLLGDWGRAESYAHDIMEDLQHWVTAWVDWNLALDLQGGPNWAGNFVDSPIIVNATGGEFYKQPMYYALAHYSKFIKSGSKRILSELRGGNKKLQVVAFRTSTQSKVLVVLNRNGSSFNLQITEKSSNMSVTNVIPAHSIQTYLWT